MPLILATATRGELKNALAAFDQGRLPDGLLTLVTGVGPLNAALRLAEMLATTPGITGVLNLGIAGSYVLDQAPLLAPVAATAEIWPEFGLRSGPSVNAKGVGFPLHERGPVFDRIALDPDRTALALGLTLPGEWTRGVSLTVAGASGDAERARNLRDAYGALTENMEGFAMALVCHDRNLPFLEVRVVSNLAGSRRPEDWRLSESLAALADVARALFSGKAQP